MRGFPLFMGRSKRRNVDPWAGIHPILRLEADYGVLTTGGLPAGFLDPVAAIINRGTASDATQDTSGSQGFYLPLINGKGYGFHPGVNGNYYSVPSSTDYDELEDLSLEWEGYIPEGAYSSAFTLIARWGPGSIPFNFFMQDGELRFGSPVIGLSVVVPYDVPGYQKIRLTRAGATFRFFSDTGSGYIQVGTDQTGVADPIPESTRAIEIGARDDGTEARWRGAVARVGIWASANPDVDPPILSIDFTDPSIPDNATSFECATGQTVTVNHSGDNPAKLIRFPKVRTDGDDDGYEGTADHDISDDIAITLYTDAATGTRGIRRSDVTTSTIIQVSGTDWTLLDSEAADLEACVVVPEDTDESLLEWIEEYFANKFDAPIL